MKNKSLGIIAIVTVLVVATIASPATANAWEWETVTFEGHVTRPNGTPIPTVLVMVDCLNSPSDVTDLSGNYHIDGSAHLCLGDTIAVSTYKEYSPGMLSDDQANLFNGTTYTTTDVRKINKADIIMKQRSYPVPEYGWIGGLVAASGGIGAIAYTRRLRKQTISRTI